MKNSTALLRVKKGYRYTRRELVRFANTSKYLTPRQRQHLRIVGGVA
ncbi:MULTISPECIES: hypothetical protein [Erwinia]|jgi:hypothetical protein|uniref:Uncharacterized protein n=1 Tax=Candidatus Erwinia dacicola TaxID=252393 RepID=A0A328TKZ1_9GAMM|nr:MULTISPECIES: hypothetical protein [Erwinia]RAP69992.1 hypothetical protein ACZ87_03212 [Candidatus Erwinia dacicola]UIA86011.1 hypothetical protein LU604_26510 [Erwinia tracheiphila]